MSNQDDQTTSQTDDDAPSDEQPAAAPAATPEPEPIVTDTLGHGSASSSVGKRLRDIVQRASHPGRRRR